MREGKSKKSQYLKEGNDPKNLNKNLMKPQEKPQKTRLVWGIYLYSLCYRGFWGLFKHFLAEKWKIILGMSPPTPISSRQGIARDSGMKIKNKLKEKKRL